MSLSLRTAKSGRINRKKPLSFRFDGQLYRAFEGDTLASGLLANGVHLDRKSTRLNSSHEWISRMPSSA